MKRFPAKIAQVLLALGSVALFRGSSCVVVYCSEDCDPCVTQCKCHTCDHAGALAFDAAHRLVAFELLQSTGADGTQHLVCAWIDGLSVPAATGRSEITPGNLREFAEGVIGTNGALLDLPAALGHWEFSAVDVVGDFALVSFTRVDAQGNAAEGSLEFVFDAHGKLGEIDRTLPNS